MYFLTLPETPFFNPPYSPDLAPSDFRLFTHLKQFWGGTRMRRDEDVKKTIKDRFSGLAAGTQKLVTRWFKVSSNDAK
jgi:truncated hemoglobin YjbI